MPTAVLTLFDPWEKQRFHILPATPRHIVTIEFDNLVLPLQFDTLDSQVFENAFATVPRKSEDISLGIRLSEATCVTR